MHTFMGHLLMENRNALIVDAALTRASGTAEREAALAMLGRRKKARRVTLGADKAYDVAEFVDALRDGAVTPHIAVDGHVGKTGKSRKTRVDRRTTRHPGYAASQRLRKRIEEGFGWIKTTGGLAKTRIAGSIGWAGCSHSPPPPTTWSGCQTPRRGADMMPGNRAIGPQTRRERVPNPNPSRP